MGRTTAGRQDLIKAAAHLSQLGFLAADSGMLSVRAGEEILFTPPGVHRAQLEPKVIESVRLDGRGKQEIRSDAEIWTHLVIYREREHIGAVVFAQPPCATGFAVAGKGLDIHVLPELVRRVGTVPLVRRESPVGQTAPEAGSIARQLDDATAFLLAHHGVVTVGADIWDAVSRQELVEQYARVLLTARLLGKVEAMPADQVARIIEAKFQAEGGRNL